MKAALGQVPLTSLLVVTVNDMGDGTSTLSHADGSVVSCQPGGTLQTRVAGTTGPYERCVLDGTLAIFCPDNVTAYSFAFAATVPNA